ncbi:hypothetical protein [Nocardia fluminea]|uniref:hypothetical protein n=1 Tax=Nocardia fluminea TaxID=134984 RepID=UPI00364FA460
MNAAARGLGDVDSTRPQPQSRAERRAEAARIHAEQAAEQAAAVEQEQPATLAGPSAPQIPIGPAIGSGAPAILTGPPTIAIPMKKRGDKRPFSTQLRGETTARLAWLVAQGGVLTDVADAAITAYLDAAGVPRPGPDGTMPPTS